LYSKLGHQAPFIASIILSGLDLIMRLVVIERSSAPAEWFSHKDEDIEKIAESGSDHRTVKDDSSSVITAKEVQEKRVTWAQLLKKPRLIVSLMLSTIVATVMSAFEVLSFKNNIKNKHQYVFDY
jgi:hypothetical protein